MNILKKTKKKIILLIVNTILSGTHMFALKRKLLNKCEGIYIGENTRIVSPIYLPVISVLDVGCNCWIGKNFSLEGNGEVYIGDNCDLGPSISFVTGSHEIGEHPRRAGKGYNGIIKIDSGTWIGAKTLILPDIEIGKGVIVGAASVVTKNLISDNIYAGNPAKIIRRLK